MADGNSNSTFVKQSRTDKIGVKSKSHPSYFQMIKEAVATLEGARKGVSKSKICEYIKTTYELREISNHHVNKALKSAMDSNIMENSTGTGVKGSFKLTKIYKDQINKKQNEPKETKSTKEKEKETDKKKLAKNTTETTSRSKKSEKDETVAKPVVKKRKPVAGKDKENKGVKKQMKQKKGSQKVLTGRINSIHKRSSIGGKKKVSSKSRLPAADPNKMKVTSRKKAKSSK